MEILSWQLVHHQILERRTLHLFLPFFPMARAVDLCILLILLLMSRDDIQWLNKEISVNIYRLVHLLPAKGGGGGGKLLFRKIPNFLPLFFCVLDISFSISLIFSKIPIFTFVSQIYTVGVGPKYGLLKLLARVWGTLYLF